MKDTKQLNRCYSPSLLLVTLLAGCGGDVTAAGGPDDTSSEVSDGAVNSVTAEALTRGDPAFPEGAKLVYLSSSGDGTLLDTGFDLGWSVIFWDEARSRRQFMWVTNGEAYFSEDDVQLSCGTDELTNVDSSAVVPDAVARVHAANPDPPQYENLFYNQWLPCMDYTSSVAAHHVTVLWSDGPPESSQWFHIYYDDDGQWLELCGPCQGATSCDDCTP